VQQPLRQAFSLHSLNAEQACNLADLEAYAKAAGWFKQSVAVSEKALPYVARRWTWLNQTPVPTAALVRGEKENYNDLAEALSMGLGPLAYATLLAKGGF
jgi:hypothetical protein